MQPIIEIKGISKKYNITHQRGGYIALRDVLATIIKSPLRFLKAKAKSVAGVDTKEEFWALKDVSVSINQGEVVGIIGSNGAGKSTLLKILTGITPPTEGEIIMHGKVASLLEVGTGFHPELTGRENIFLNGAILGMTKKEIASKFDEIVAFSGIEQFLDTPVKYYSSGMYVRLAFSVAAHMEPDILLVDEVLAVGDAEFQKKCIGKMEEVSTKSGRTILFVSHNMGAIQNLCSKVILLKKGRIVTIGTPQVVIREYLSREDASVNEFPINSQKNLQIRKISVVDALLHKPNSSIPIDHALSIEIDFEVFHETTQCSTTFFFYKEGRLLLISSDMDKNQMLKDYKKGIYKTTILIPPNLFNVGDYFFDIIIHKPPYTVIFDFKKNLTFGIIPPETPRIILTHENMLGAIGSILDFETQKI